MRTVEEMMNEVEVLIARCPNITENEIVKKLKISQRFLRKLLDNMIKNGDIKCPN